jgi:hypothetical protein
MWPGRPASCRDLARRARGARAPRATPAPAQTRHGTPRHVTRAVVPRATSSSVTVAGTCTSAPRRGRAIGGADDDVREEIAEGGRRLRMHLRREVEAGNAGIRRSGRGEFTGVVALAAGRVDERFVRGRDVAEAGRRFAIAGIDVGMVLTGETSVGATDIAVVRLPSHAQHAVEVHGRYQYGI